MLGWVIFQNLGKKMTCHQFIVNISHGKHQYSRDLLKSLYSAIKSLPIEWIELVANFCCESGKHISKCPVSYLRTGKLKGRIIIHSSLDKLTVIKLFL